MEVKKNKYDFSRIIQGIIVLLIMFYAAAPASANEKMTIYPQGETISEMGSFSVQVENSEHSTIIIQSGDKKIFSKTIEFGMIEAVISTEKSGVGYLTVVSRLAGSSNYLQFEVLKIEGDHLNKIYESPFYDRATYELAGDNLQITYPSIEKEKSFSPGLIITDQYTFGKGFESAISEEKIDSHTPDFSAQSLPNQSIIGQDATPAQINQILTEEAVKRDMPPEIVKAIAYQESWWSHAWNPRLVSASYYQNNCTVEKANKNPGVLAWDGSVMLGSDCIGIGIMQVSDWRYIEDKKTRDAYVDRLKNDIRFNISEGLKILEQKWRYSSSLFSDGKPFVPAVNDKDRKVLDNWYFAALAYNGMLLRNDPTANNARIPYQQEIYNKINSMGLIEVTPFPVKQLKTYYNSGSSILRFEKNHYMTPNPLTISKSQLTAGDAAYINFDGVNIRSLSNVNQVSTPALSEGTRVTVLDHKPQYPNSVTSHYTFIPVRTETGRVGYVASSYLNPLSHSLAGQTRYDTGVSISNFGWNKQYPDSVVLGRGDLPIDSLTGSVLAADKNAPLLLTTSRTLQESVMKEIERLNPKNVYILGGELAISVDVANILAEMKVNVIRVTGKNRYETAVSVANAYSGSSVNEIFVTTGDEKSPDALSIASYAGSKSIPILLTSSNALSSEVTNFIKNKKVKKVTIVGGTIAVSAAVEKQLKDLKVSVERVSGSDRYETSVAIAKKYFPQNDNLTNVFFARGDIIVDALSGSALAAKYRSPMILTRNTSVPDPVSTWLGNVNASPTLFYLGSDSVIIPEVREKLEKIMLK
ncbi:cell wall-binding repeat-containing protein [Jeotgalibacillus proteolyticus]|uniref:cell wall-binding repeat-containing protein n=1 Tax=Jeotgalibacillus proteolyticus TaxID=2082395 RepID=UPI003CF9CCA4